MEQILTEIWVGNLGEAAALVTLGHKVVDIRLNPRVQFRRQTQFGFAANETINGTIDSYLKGQLNINAKTYYGSIAELKKQRFDFEASLPAEDDNLNNLRSY